MWAAARDDSSVKIPQRTLIQPMRVSASAPRVQVAVRCYSRAVARSSYAGLAGHAEAARHPPDSSPALHPFS
jgi:hypothetical protein